MVTSLKRASWAQGVTVEAQSAGVRGRKPIGCRVRRVHASRGTHPSGSSHHQLLVMVNQEAGSHDKRQRDKHRTKRWLPGTLRAGTGLRLLTPSRSGH